MASIPGGTVHGDRASATVGDMSLARRSTVALVVVCLALAGCDDGRGSMMMMPPPGSDAGPGGTDAGSMMMMPPPSGCPAPPAAACEVIDIASLVPLDTRGATVMATDDFGGSSCGVGRGGGMGGTGARDIAYRFTAPEAGLYEVTTTGSSFDTLLSLRADCDGMELACNDDIGGGNTQSSVSIELAACQTILIVVDGYNADAMGDVVVNVLTHETACGDGNDNDGDGLTDCDDGDCFSLECNGGDDWPMEWQAFEWQVLDETNRYRAMGFNCDTEGNFGPAGPLEMDSVIQIAARGHSLEMGEMRFFDHQSPDGRTFDVRMRNAGFDGRSPWGENIAAGQRTPAEVVAGWMESDGHCSNIMNPSYRVIGVGYAYVEGSPYGHYWTQNFAASH